MKILAFLLTGWWPIQAALWLEWGVWLGDPFSDNLGNRFVGGEWRADATHNMLTAVTNGGTRAADALLTLHYDGGKKKYVMQQTIPPGEQMWVNFADLIHNRVPDRKGHVLPSDLSYGTYDLQDLGSGPGSLLQGNLALDTTWGHHGAPPPGPTCCAVNVAFNPSFMDLPVDFQDAPLEAEGTDQCSGKHNVSGEIDTWWSDNPSIAQVAPQKVTAVAPGLTEVDGSGLFLEGQGSNCVLRQVQVEAPVTVVNVQITGADLENNQVNVTLSGPSGTSGTLEVIAIGVKNQPQVTYNGGAAVGPGSYNVAFNRPTWPADTYSSVKAIWNYNAIPATATLNLTRAWLVLGLIRHSQYNTPYESACSGSPQAAWFFNASCTFTQTSLKSDFVSQTYINGTGVSQSHGVLKYSTSCTNYPSGANAQNSFLTVSNVTGACNTTMTGGVSVATYPSPNVGNPYSCGDNTLLVTSSNTNEAVKDVADYCPACSGGFNGTNGHIDDYSSSQACSGSGVGDLGDFWTADTH